jgi:hypothetical protein
MRTSLFFLVLLLIPTSIFAHPVITEVMWMGTDLSTSDEWVEIFNPEITDIDLSNWAFTSLNSSAREVVAIRFAT